MGPARNVLAPFRTQSSCQKTFKAKTRGVCPRKAGPRHGTNPLGWSIPLKVNFLRRSTQVTNIVERYRCSAGTVRYLLRIELHSYHNVRDSLPFQPVTQSFLTPKQPYRSGSFSCALLHTRGPVIIQTARNVFPTSIPAHRSTAAQITLFSFRAGEQPTSSQRYFSSARLLHSGIPYVDLTLSNVSALAFTGIDRATVLKAIQRTEVFAGIRSSQRTKYGRRCSGRAFRRQRRVSKWPENPCFQVVGGCACRRANHITRAKNVNKYKRKQTTPRKTRRRRWFRDAERR